MSADLLRQAAALMRSDALAMQEDGDWERGIAKLGRRTIKGLYFATWHPGVALAVADWLDEQARSIGMGEDDNWPTQTAALAVARAYLGDDCDAAGVDS